MRACSVYPDLMATKRLPCPRDPIALAKLIGDIATEQMADVVDDGKDPATSEPAMSYRPLQRLPGTWADDPVGLQT